MRLQWWIQWDSGLPGEFLSNSGLPFPAILPRRVRVADPTRSCSGIPATDVKFFPTPEPGSLALLFGALGAGWLVRRRRTAA